MLEVVKQYRRYLQDCLGAYEVLKVKTCPVEDDDYEFWNQRNNPKFYVYTLFPIFEDREVKFVEFSYENQDSIIKENELYLTIAFSKSNTDKIVDWFKENTNFDFSVDCIPPNFNLMRILVKDIVDMIYTTEVEELKIHLEESFKQCEDDEDILKYTEPSHYPPYDGDWSYNESLNTTLWIKDNTYSKYKNNEM